LSASYAGGSLTVSASTGGLAANTYTGSVSVTSDHGGTVDIAVTLTVSRTTDVADLVVSPTYVRMDAVEGGGNPSDQTVLISNGGGGTLAGLAVGAPNYTIGTPGWLTATLVGTTSVTLEASTGSLGNGQHRATVDVTSTNGGPETVTVDVFVAAPELTLSSERASFSAEEGDATSTPASITIDVSNTGAGSFSSLGTVDLGTVSGAWLGASLNGATDQVTLTADPTGFGANTYSGSVPVTSTAGGNRTIDVTLTVAPAPAGPILEVSSSTVTFFAQEGGGDPASEELTLSNGGGGDFAALGSVGAGTITYVPAVPPGEEWLTATPSGQVVTLEAETGTKTVAGGPYQATFQITSAAAPVTVTVDFHIHDGTAGTTLELGATSVDFSAVFGGADPAQRVVAVSNSGGGSLGNIAIGGITYDPGASGWLDNSSSSNTDVTLVAETGILAAGGPYTATLEVTSVGGGPKDISVSFTVEAPVLSLASEYSAFSAQEGGGDPAAQNVAYFNSGAGTDSDLDPVTVGTITYSPPGTDWLTATPGAGVVGLEPETAGLTEGVYEATVPVVSTRGGNASLTVAFSISATSEVPVLALSASTVDFTAILGGSSPSSKIVTFSNSGGGTAGDLGNLGIGSIDYHTGGTGWLSTSTSTNSEVTLNPITGTLAAQTHVATVQITSDAVGIGPEDIEVSITVASPVLTASSLGLSFTGQENGAVPAGQSVTFSNTGAGNDGNLGSVTVGTITGGGTWLIAPVDGAAVAGGTLDFSVTQATTAPGIHTATVPVTSEYGGDQDIEVSLSVVRETDDPVLVLSATTVRFDALVGGGNPEPQSVTISNAGGGTLLNIQLGTPSYGAGALGWITPSRSGNTITIQANTTGLIEGTFTATLPVSTSNGGSDQIDITCVVGTSRITLAPRTVSFGDTVGGPGPTPVMVAIANTGGGSYTSLGVISTDPTVYGVGASGWLEATFAAPDTLEVRAITAGLETRSAPYEARVPVVSTLGGTDTVLVSFTVAPGAIPPQLALSLDSMTFAGILGGAPPSAQTVVGFNSGGGDIGAMSIGGIDYGNGAQGWLTGSVLGSSITFEPTVDGLQGGTHSATVIVASENGGEAPLHVSLVLVPPVLSLSSQTVTFSDTVGSPDTLRTQVFISNTGSGNRASLGLINLGIIAYPQGESGWLTTDPEQGDTIEGFVLGLEGVAAGLPEGGWLALVPVESEWGGADTVAVTFAARKPDRSFDLPSIELVKDSLVGGSVVKVPLAGDSLVVGPVVADSAQVGVRVGVRNGTETRLDLTGLRVGIPSYPANQPTGWITGAFLDRTTATFEDPAELFVVVVPADLASGRYEGRLVVSSQTAGWEKLTPVILRIILIVS